MIVEEFKIGNAVIKIDDSCISETPEKIISRLEEVVSRALAEQLRKKGTA